MTKYQIHLIVDIEATDGDDAHDTAERLGDFLGLHHLTTTSGSVTAVMEVEEQTEDEVPTDLDEDLDEDLGSDAIDVESLVEVAHAMDDTDFVTNFG